MENKMLGLTPDKEYLQTDENGSEYYAYFSAETIDELTRRFVIENKEEILYYLNELNSNNDGK